MTEKFNEMPTAERERKLWEASQEYIRGKIEVDDLEKIESPYVEHFKMASLTPSKTEPIDNLSSMFLIILFTAIIIGGFILFIYTKEQLVLVLPSILCYPLAILAKFFFSKEKVKEIVVNKRGSAKNHSD